jgi:hypothetical protein
MLSNSNAIEGGNYVINNSLRCQSASSQYLNRTWGTPTDGKKFTSSFWIKRGLMGAYYQLYGGGTGAANSGGLQLTPSDTLNFHWDNGTTCNLYTVGVFRDPSAWYHILVIQDTTQATASNRVLIYINGVLQTLTGSYPALNGTASFNASTVPFALMAGRTTSFSLFTDGYIAECHWVDGQALTPSSFGQTDATTGQWVAKKYTGTYGTNGFYLDFKDGTSTTTLGYDAAGSNDWTLTNFTRSAGVSDCWMKDVPSGNGGGSGTRPSSNYAVLNPLWKSSNITLAGANLNATSSTTGGSALSSIVMTSGKWYCEATIVTGSDATIVGIVNDIFVPTGTITVSNAVGYYGNNGDKFVNGTQTTYGATYTTNDVIGIALDVDGGTVTFYKNNTSQGAITTGLTGSFYFATSDASSGSNINQSWNFGQRSFAYTPPTGFKALCTANLPQATIVKGNKHFDVKTRSGTGSSSTITGIGFQPDLVWLKSRNNVNNHGLFDKLRGATKALFSDLTNAETTYVNGLSAFNSDGYSFAGADWNANTVTYVDWLWKANGAGVTNTNGSITSTVSANTTAGFSIVTYTGTGANATVGHGLGIAPKMVVFKNRNSGVATSWRVYHWGLDASAPQNYNLLLEGTAARQLNANIMNNTAPTSSVFSLGISTDVNENAKNLVAYCFAEIAGYSKFGKYTGNGSADGPFVYLGFRPKFVMIKRIDTTGNWVLLDTSRDTANLTDNVLYTNLSQAEDAPSAVRVGDILSNGFKARGTDSDINTSGGTYIYACFAESPFASSNAR